MLVRILLCHAKIALDLSMIEREYFHLHLTVVALGLEAHILNYRYSLINCNTIF